MKVWYIDLRDRLPTIAIPLREPYADAPLDLQAALDDAYRRAHYAQSLDYTDDVSFPQIVSCRFAMGPCAECQLGKLTRFSSVLSPD
ncbi:MAG: DUF4058 family protein [Caldilineaceae bacterium]